MPLGGFGRNMRGAECEQDEERLVALARTSNELIRSLAQNIGLITALSGLVGLQDAVLIESEPIVARLPIGQDAPEIVPPLGHEILGPAERETVDVFSKKPSSVSLALEPWS